MNRTKIENVLMDMGVPAGIKGFAYIADAVEYIDKHGEDIGVTKELYPNIAQKRHTTASKVERAIRHAFEIARSPRGDCDMVEKYIGFMHCTNFASLVMLQKKIKQECGETEVKCEEIDKPKEQNTMTAVTALEIREIIRQELRLVLKELKGAAM